ncbi:MAG: NADP-specific glutamate dehydrogenase [Verrucomicrobiota bacterium]|nr:NADP-specific glutamate dehydrogenase [Verrucomicrobiota bacterium]MDY5596162.1 NADP-specific glutamate dehydrogenase [Kiritimatiellia bacterium]
MSKYVQTVLADVKAKNPNEPEFIQAVEEVLLTLDPVLEANRQYEDAAILERIVEPERVIMFRVPWIDDKGVVRVNRGYRVQYNSAIGPYKGGLRFDPTVNLSVLKFLGFEQVFKNSLTTLPMGGGKGGSDFNPKQSPHTPGIRCSDNEVMRFCQSFMTELYRHIGPDTDVPAGDMNVGGREIGYLFGQYKRIANEWSGVLTGKAREFGGSLIRPEATGYGDVYFAENMLAVNGDTLEGKVCAVSGSGNVASFAAQKLIRLGAKVVTLSDRSGTLYVADGYTEKLVDEVMNLKTVKRGELSELASAGKFFAGANPWQIADRLDCAFPCSRQNELDGKDAEYLVKHGVKLVGEGANMPSTPDAVEAFLAAKVLFSPGKASNAGGVATSGLEMSQNSERLSWTADEVDAKLKGIMKAIHDNAYEAAAKYGMKGNYVAGANIAGFVKVANAMVAQGVC